MAFYNSICYWCKCKDCNQKKCPDGMYRCINICAPYSYRYSKDTCKNYKDKAIKTVIIKVKGKYPRKSNLIIQNKNIVVIPGYIWDVIIQNAMFK
jgi:hypothetical protein